MALLTNRNLLPSRINFILFVLCMLLLLSVSGCTTSPLVFVEGRPNPDAGIVGVRTRVSTLDPAAHRSAPTNAG